MENNKETFNIWMYRLKMKIPVLITLDIYVLFNCTNVYIFEIYQWNKKEIKLESDLSLF